MKPAIYKNYLLSVLLVILAFNFVDRLALGLVLQDIKLELDLTDTQLGFLSGLAFALFYSVMGIPLARWADRGNRVTIISVTTMLWSACVALCGLAGSFVQLLLVRIGIAVGEAGCLPPAHSLIADYFNRSERPRALALYTMGGPLSFVFGYFLAGWLNEFYGWRVMFMLLGLPGVALALVAWLTLREPRLDRAAREQTATDRAPSSEQAEVAQPSMREASMREVVVTLWSNVTFRHLLFCFAVYMFFNYGLMQWQPVFFIRSYGVQTGELGTWFALIWGVGGLLGTYLGGELATRHASNNESLQLKVMAWVYAGFGIVKACIYLSPTHYMALAMMALVAVGMNLVTGPLFATIQTLVPERMRAMSIATIYLVANFVGMGLGPLAAGIMSDALRPTFGDESLRYALVALCPGFFWAGWHLWRASQTVTRDLKAAQQTEQDAEQERLLGRAQRLAAAE